MILDGAEVISISRKDNFGVVKHADNNVKPIPIMYLAICQYENDELFHVFLCDDMFDVEQDCTFNTVEEAKQYALVINKHLKWETGIKYILFNEVDFKGGKVNSIEIFGEDMLEISYPNGYMIDVGYIEDMKSFAISIIKDHDWVNIVNESYAKTDIDLKRKMKEAIQWVIAQER